MNEELQLYMEDAQERMNSAIEHLNKELLKIRAGKASHHMLDSVKVDYYGNETPLARVANINTTDARTLVIQPWEKNMLAAIERAIINSNLGLTPSNNGELIRINVPPLTEERRKGLVKQVKHEGEEAKVSIRNSRKEINTDLKKLEKEGTISEDELKIAEEEVQELTKKFSELAEKAVEVKEKEIMTV
jgi:ribosome recycling factor